MPDMSWAIAYSYILIATFTARSSAQGLITDVEGPDGGGGSGSSSGSGVSSAGMIALCTVAGVVVFIGITSTALFIIAKRRQWAMREAISRSARRATQAIKTPLSARFQRSQVQRGGMSSDDLPIHRVQERSQRPKANSKNNDVEKNAVVTEHETTRRTRGSFFPFGRS
ncbi:hypothetical protein BDV29DRAFT_170248 [Aspergillus leporis]|uniref:Transmembrane protein n=1 Tax=Aspergillus leporis TaxID=41062 RepID=A0A5N5X6R6_9EURO|nr:hypothetical protein BDV29DRAFT_170248 [Aspergillus leporis]